MELYASLTSLPIISAEVNSVLFFVLLTFTLKKNEIIKSKETKKVLRVIK